MYCQVKFKFLQLSQLKSSSPRDKLSETPGRLWTIQDDDDVPVCKSTHRQGNKQIGSKIEEENVYNEENEMKF